MKLVLLAFVVVSATPSIAAAEDCAEAGQHLRIARRAVQVGDYTRAIAEFRTSYEEDGQPLTLIFLARAYAQTGQLAQAIDLYRGYLEQVPAGRRTFSVEGEIVRLSKLLLAQRIAIFDDSDESSFRAVPVVD